MRRPTILDTSPLRRRLGRATPEKRGSLGLGSRTSRRRSALPSPLGSFTFGSLGAFAAFTFGSFGAFGSLGAFSRFGRLRFGRSAFALLERPSSFFQNGVFSSSVSS